MIKRSHSRFFWTLFSLVCLILFVVFLTAGIVIVRFVDRSIKRTLDETLHYATGEIGRVETETKIDFVEFVDPDEDEPKVGGTQFPAYLFRIVQAKPDPNATELSDDDEIQMLRGDYAYFDDPDSWRALFDIMLKSKRPVNWISSETLCFEVERDEDGILLIAVIDYAGYRSLLVRLELSVAAGVIALAGAFLLMMNAVATRILEPVELAWENQERFVGDASHEIKTPLAIILSTSELSASDDPVENERRFAVIRDEARRINLLVSRMLESARIKNKAARHSNDAVFSLSDAVMECTLRYESLLYEQGVETVTDVEDGLYICAEESAFKQVLCALLDNAVKYTPSGQRASVTAHRHHHEAEITARTEGRGIKESEREVIFERFYRADVGRLHVEGSYGLGLAICKNLIETMGGTIRCESDGETYTSFVITMKLARHPQEKKKRLTNARGMV